VTQGLQKTAHAVLAIAGAQQHGRDLVGAELVVQVAIDQRLLGRDILDQLLEELVVELRQRLQHLAARFALARQDLGRHLDQVGSAARLVAIGALAHEVDIAHRLLAAVGRGMADRYLAQQQLARRDGLQRRQHVAHADLGGIDLVDEDDMGDVVVFDELQERRQRHDALGRRLADHDGRVAHGERRKGVVLEFDRAWNVEKSPLIAEVVDRGDVDLGAHAALARLGRTVADRGACARRPAPADGPRGVEDALEQAGLAREIRPAQRHHAVRAAAWSASRDGLGFDVVHDNVLLPARSLAPKKLRTVGRCRTRPERSLVPEIVSLRVGGVNPSMWRSVRLAVPVSIFIAMAMRPQWNHEKATLPLRCTIVCVSGFSTVAGDCYTVQAPVARSGNNLSAEADAVLRHHPFIP